MKIFKPYIFFTFIVFAITLGCDEDDLPSRTQPPESVESDITARYYFRGDVGATPYLIQLDVDGAQIDLLYRGEQRSENLYTERRLIAYLNVTNEDGPRVTDEFQIGFVGTYAKEPTAEQVIGQMFAVAAYPFGNFEQSIRGAVVEWNDFVNDVKWTSYFPPAAQDDSEFVITNVEGLAQVGTEDILLRVTGSLACNLYNDQGDMIRMSNAQYVALFDPNRSE